MKKIISFSLWGNNPKYTTGAIKNAHLAIRYFPGWKCRYYLANDVEDKIIDSLSRFNNVELVHMNEPGNWKGMYWRFYPASEDDVDVMCSRDTDSRLGAREKAAVDEWLASDRGFHVMRDHPAHCIGVLGGGFGCKRGVVRNMKELIETHITDENRWGIDQEFLCSIIEPMVRPTWMEHDSFYNIEKRKTDPYCRPFPTPRDRETMFFFGQPFDANDKPEIILTTPGVD